MPTPNKSIELYPTDRGAEKALGTRLFLIPQISKVFVPFENALDYRLVPLFHLAYVPKARINGFFHDGFVGKKTHGCKVVVSNKGTANG